MTGRIFDAHAHLAPVPGATERLPATMDSCGIDRTIVMAGGVVDPDVLSRQIAQGGQRLNDADNETVLSAAKTARGRLIPLFFANPHGGAAPYREAASGFRGLKLAPGVHGVALDDPRTEALVEVAAQVGHHVYLHCLGRPGFGVADLVRLAGRFPGTVFVLGHAGGGDMDLHGIDQIAPDPDILLETSGGYTAVIRAALERLGPDRVLFGSEYPLQHPEAELVEYRLLGLPEDVSRRVLWTNTHRLIDEETK
ncbi:amidohydrolase family protein [Nocardiopsis sp. NPDC055551]